MNLAQFKDLVSHMCFVGTVVVSWSLTQEVAGFDHFSVMTNILSLRFAVETFKEIQIYHSYYLSSQWNFIITT